MVAFNPLCQQSLRSTPVHRLRNAWPIVAILLVVFGAPRAEAQGILQTMRDDVRSSAAQPSSSSGSQDRPHGHGPHDDDDDSGFGPDAAWFCCEISFWTLTSPWWAPYSALDDDLAVQSCFPRFPYDDVPGYMVRADWAARTLDQRLPEQPQAQPSDYVALDPSLARFKRWSGRVSGEYAGDNDDLSRIGGRFLLDTSSRWGLDTEMDYLQENLPGGGHDQLWLGDCNVVFRFAQSEHMQWRTGLGFNWLDDPGQTDFGVNFTYGVDWFPRKPWVFSADVDWGSLGRAEQFRFRTTAGVLLWGIESYVGYEYYDLDSSQDNRLIGGVRIWF